MLVKRKLYSVMDEEGNLGYYLYDENNGDEKLFSANDEVFEQREFGTNSKILGFLSPGAYQAKEVAKYAYDEDEYKKRRAGYALKGAFTPITATVLKKKVERMKREGASKQEIRDYLERNSGGKHLAAGLGEMAANVVTLGATGSIGSGLSAYNAIGDKISNNRAYRTKD